MTPEEQAANHIMEYYEYFRGHPSAWPDVVSKIARLIREKDQRIATLEQENRDLREGLDANVDLWSALNTIVTQTHYQTTLALQYDDEDGYWFGMVQDDRPPRTFPVMDDTESPRRATALDALMAAIQWHNRDTEDDMRKGVNYRTKVKEPNPEHFRRAAALLKKKGKSE